VSNPTGRHVRPDPRFAMIYQPHHTPPPVSSEPHPLIQGMIWSIGVGFTLSAVLLLWLDAALLLIVLLRLVIWGHL